MHLVERHLVGEMGTSWPDDASQLHLAQVNVPQFLESTSIVPHPKLGQGLRIGQGAAEPAPDGISAFVDEGQLIARRDPRMAGKRLFHERGSRAREAEDE